MIILKALQFPSLLKLGKKYKSIRMLLAVLLVIFIISVLLLPIKLLFKALLIAVFLIAFLFIKLQIESRKSNILYQECNPEKYYCVNQIYHNGFVSFDDMMAMSALGDFNRAAAFFKAEISMPKNKTKYYKENLKLSYAECLFSAGAYDESLKVSTDFQNQFSDEDLKNNIYLMNHNLYSFFGNFIKKDYDACIVILDTLKSSELKYHNLFKCKVNYYYAITYYYSNHIEKAKEYFEKIKEINDSLYYSKKARIYLDNINKDKHLELSFDEIPGYESAPVDVEEKKKENRKVYIKALLALAFIAVLFVSVYFLISMDGNKKGTAEEVISYSMEIEADIKAILPVENESASLCVFQNKKDLDYLYVAYLESYENGLYSYGIAYDFLAGEDGVYSLLDAYDKNKSSEALFVEDFAASLHKDEPFKESFDDYEYFFSSGKKGINVVFKIARNKQQIPNDVHAESFVYTMENGKEKTYYIYVVDIEKENSIGYSTGIY